MMTHAQHIRLGVHDPHCADCTGIPHDCAVEPHGRGKYGKRARRTPGRGKR